MEASPGVIVLLALTAVAAVTDGWRGRIPNWITYPGILLGLAINSAATGWPGFEEALKGFLLCGVLMVVCFVLFRIGGGDVKLVAMMGAFLGPQRGIESLLWTFLIGGVIGLAVIIWKVGFLRIVSKTWEHARLVVQGRGWVPLTREERKPLQSKLYLAPSAFAAVCLVLADQTWHLYSVG